MAKKSETPVIFRKWPKSEGGDIIALFPTELGTNDPYTCSSYEHVGQHGAAEPVGVIQRTKSAKPSEYADLLAELRSIGYDDLKIYQKYQQGFLAERKKKLAEMYQPETVTSRPKSVKRRPRSKPKSRSRNTDSRLQMMR